MIEGAPGDRLNGLTNIAIRAAEIALNNVKSQNLTIDYNRLADCIVNAMHQPEPYITIDEVAQRLQLPRSTIYQYTSKKKIPFYKKGKKLLFRWSKIQSWVEDSTAR